MRMLEQYIRHGELTRQLRPVAGTQHPDPDRYHTTATTWSRLAAPTFLLRNVLAPRHATRVSSKALPNAITIPVQQTLESLPVDMASPSLVEPFRHFVRGYAWPWSVAATTRGPGQRDALTPNEPATTR